MINDRWSYLIYPQPAVNDENVFTIQIASFTRNFRHTDLLSFTDNVKETLLVVLGVHPPESCIATPFHNRKEICQ